MLLDENAALGSRERAEVRIGHISDARAPHRNVWKSRVPSQYHADLPAPSHIYIG